ncbi:NADP-dependent leukotriene B4 12-hydroxydehydrogenase [Culex quinquefasciatus]|uniref:Prostaglandin reductase 1 n=1 Tax=Culex quinquefasciatus TaxID=7176 RepID=B0X3D5_CULQU|nr:NADP-dependent leukotriene B4 12-hydroxydehydrogenase [Culex quinquefasciatus]|eukprot:XP_001864157.1 NADP-dependent leukotriene B4 12-hydroxydehydrogenase [Culex quinquefasciatus]
MVYTAKKWIYARAFDGEPKLDDFRLEEEVMPELQDGEFLAEAEFLSVDPYMRIYILSYPVGSVMIGGQVARVLESRNAGFPVGAYVFGQFGWRTVSICDPRGITVRKPYVLPDFGASVPRSVGIGACGTVGNSAYFGFLEICRPKEGETVVVSGAAGAVGSLVGQIGKIKGCRVIGIAGTDEKCAWLRELGFDHAINYKTADIGAELGVAAPEGVDCYFDNVGGKISEMVRKQMRSRGRIAVCGTISMYNGSPTQVADPQRDFVWKELVQEGFSVHRWTDRWLEGIGQNLKWIQEGKLKYRETVTEGFENMPKAFIEMMKGGNIGKAIVKV